MSENTQERSPQAQVETPPKGEATPSDKGAEVQTKAKVYTQDEVSKIQSALRKETQTYKDKASKVDELQAQLDVLKAELDTPYTTEDAKQMAAIVRQVKIDIAKTKAELTGAKTELDKFQAKEVESQRHEVAKTLAERSNVDVNALLECKSEADMYEAIALGKVKPRTDETPLPPVTTPSKTTVSPTFTQEQIKAMSPEDFTKNRPAIMQQMMEGRLT